MFCIKSFAQAVERSACGDALISGTSILQRVFPSQRAVQTAVTAACLYLFHFKHQTSKSGTAHHAYNTVTKALTSFHMQRPLAKVFADDPTLAIMPFNTP
jgi:hypothetical protein